MTFSVKTTIKSTFFSQNRVKVKLRNVYIIVISVNIVIAISFSECSTLFTVVRKDNAYIFISLAEIYILVQIYLCAPFQKYLFLSRNLFSLQNYLLQNSHFSIQSDVENLKIFGFKFGLGLEKNPS